MGNSGCVRLATLQSRGSNSCLRVHCAAVIGGAGYGEQRMCRISDFTVKGRQRLLADASYHAAVMFFLTRLQTSGLQPPYVPGRQDTGDRRCDGFAY